jgi:hypothetical protein
VHAPTGDKDDYIKDSFYEKLEEVFHNFPRYHMKILLRVFNAKVPIICNERLQEASNNNLVRVVNFATSNLIIKSTTFPHCDIHKHIWTSLDGATHNEIDHVLIDKRRH